MDLVVKTLVKYFTSKDTSKDTDQVLSDDGFQLYGDVCIYLTPVVCVYKYLYAPSGRPGTIEDRFQLYGDVSLRGEPGAHSQKYHICIDI